MGNTQGAQRRESKHAQVVTVLQGDGRVLEFPRPLRVSDLLLDHPEHFVCHSSALVLFQHGKMLPPNTLLMPGNVYFLLPVRKSLPSSHSESKAENIAALAEEKPREECKPVGTMKFLITKQQLAKILAEGTIKIAVKEPEPILPELRTYPSLPSRLSVLNRPSPSVIKRAASWSPRLESISEVPVM